MTGGAAASLDARDVDMEWRPRLIDVPSTAVSPFEASESALLSPGESE